MIQQAKSFTQNFRRTLVSRKNRVTCLAIIALLITFFCLGLFTSGLPVGTDLLLLPMQLSFIKSHSLWFSLWIPLDSFGYPIFFGTQFNFVLLLFGLISDAVLATKLYVYAVFLLAGFSMYFFCYHYTDHHVASLVAATMFVFNPMFLFEVYDGHHTIIFGYALAPVLFFTYDRAIITGKARDIVLAILAFTTLFIAGHPETTYIFSSFLLLFALFEFFLPRTGKNRFDALKRVAGVSSLMIIFLILLSAYEIVPVMFNAMWSNVLFSLGYTIEDAYAYSSATYYIFLVGVPLLILVTVLLRRNRYALFFSLSALLSSIISMGPYPPFGIVFTWAFMHVPLFNMFRAPYRFSLMTAFSLSFLAAFAIATGSTRLRSQNTSFMQHKAKRIFPISKRMLAALALASIIVGSGFYVAFGAFGFPLSTFSFPDSYAKTYEWIAQQPGDYRILTVPYPVHYVDTSLMIGVNKGWVWDPPVYGQAVHGKVVVTGYGGTIDTSDFLNFLSTQILYNRTDDLMKVLGTFNVKYVTVNPYPFRDMPELTESMKTFFSFQKGLVPVYGSDNITVLKNNYWTPHIFSAENYGLVVGGLDVLLSLQKVDTFNLSQWVLFFANQLDDNTLSRLIENANMIVLSDDGFRDLVIMSINAGVRIRAAQYAFPSSNPSRYWIASNWWMNQGKLVINGASLRTNGSNCLEIPFNIQYSDEYSIFLRVAFAPDRGKLSIGVDSSPLTSIVPHANSYAGFKWVDAGSISLDNSEHILKLENDGSGFNDIDEVAIIPNREFESKVDDLEQALEASSARVVYVLEAENAFTYQDLHDWSIKPSYEASNGYALVYNHTQESSKLSGEIFLPRSEEYMFGSRILGGTNGNITVNVDQSQQFIIQSHNLSSGWNWISLGPIKLASGQHEIFLESAGDSQIDEFIFYSTNERSIPISRVFETEPQTSVSYEQVNAYTYRVNVKAVNPFFLVFSESYHPLWKVEIDGEMVSALPAYSFVNAFYISKLGNYDVTVEFIGQNYVVYGGLISLVTIMFLIVYLIFNRKINSFIAKKFARRIKS